MSILRLGSNQYHLEKVITLGGAGPIINVSEAALNDDSNIDYVAIHLPVNPACDNGTIVFFKQNGKYTILCGKATARKFMDSPKYTGGLQGHLISTVVLKRTKVSET